MANIILEGKLEELHALVQYLKNSGSVSIRGPKTYKCEGGNLWVCKFEAIPVTYSRTYVDLHGGSYLQIGDGCFVPVKA